MHPSFKHYLIAATIVCTAGVMAGTAQATGEKLGRPKAACGCRTLIQRL